MADAGTRRGRRIAFAFGAALVALVVVRWRTVKDEAPPAPPPVAPATQAPIAPATHHAAARHAAAASPAAVATEASSGSLPTPRVFDLATLAGPDATPGTDAGEQPVTNEWFTQEDLRHPELYFERAAEIPELNRPEERQDTLEFFLAYRERLRSDLAAAEDQDERREISATIARYDDAIERLRALIGAP